MLEKTELLVIFPTYNDLATIKQTLPSVVEDCRATGAKLIVHDCSTENRNEIWAWLQKIGDTRECFLILSSRMSMADARNSALQLGISLFAPDFICMLEDDHGFHPGMARALIDAMRTHYGKLCPNGLLYGLFTGCRTCWNFHKYNPTYDGHSYPDESLETWGLGGANSCFRAAPTSHWISVLKGYDPDEYYISNFQTRNMNFRNYNNGFTTLGVADGKLSFALERRGAGYTREPEARGWDESFTKSDRRNRALK